MIQKMSWWLVNYFIKHEIILKEDDEIHAFGFECLIADIIQYTILILSGLIFNNIIGVILTTVGFVSVRKYAGGYHANSHFSCITIASISIVGITLLSSVISIWFNIPFIFMACTIIYLQSPIQHKNNPKTESDLNAARKLSLRNTFVLSLLSALLAITPYQVNSIYISGGLLIASCTLFVGKMVNKRNITI